MGVIAGNADAGAGDAPWRGGRAWAGGRDLLCAPQRPIPRCCWRRCRGWTADDAGARQRRRPTLLDVTDLKVSFPVAQGLFQKAQRIARGGWGELYAAPGRNAGRGGGIRLRQIHLGPRRAAASAGTAWPARWCGWAAILARKRREEIRAARKDFQIVFQDPLASLDPRQPIGVSIAEPLQALAPGLSREECAPRSRAMMEKVGLDPGLDQPLSA